MIVEETEHRVVSGSSGILHKRSVYVNILNTGNIAMFKSLLFDASSLSKHYLRSDVTFWFYYLNDNESLYII